MRGYRCELFVLKKQCVQGAHIHKVRKANINKKEHSHIRKERYKFCIREDTCKGRGLHVQTIVFVSHSLACTCMCTCKYTIHKHTSTRWEIERGGGDKHLTPSSVVQLTYKLTSCSSQHLPFLWELVTQRSNCTGVELIVRRMEGLVQKEV